MERLNLSKLKLESSLRRGGGKPKKVFEEPEVKMPYGCPKKAFQDECIVP